MTLLEDCPRHPMHQNRIRKQLVVSFSEKVVSLSSVNPHRCRSFKWDQLEVSEGGRKIPTYRG